MCVRRGFNGLVMTTTVDGLAMSGTDSHSCSANVGIPHPAASTTTSALNEPFDVMTPVHAKELPAV